MGFTSKVTFHTAEVVRAIEDAAAQRMAMAVNEVRNTVLETLSGKRSGKLYTVPGTRRKYRASKPGEAPAVATARLRQSVETKVSSKGKKVIGEVGTPLVYGVHLEKGTRRMKKRPWLRKSFQETPLEDILGGDWKL